MDPPEQHEWQLRISESLPRSEDVEAIVGGVLCIIDVSHLFKGSFQGGPHGSARGRHSGSWNLPAQLSESLGKFRKLKNQNPMFSNVRDFREFPGLLRELCQHCAGRCRHCAGKIVPYAGPTVPGPKEGAGVRLEIDNRRAAAPQRRTPSEAR